MQPIEMYPTTVGLHYGQLIFEGLKAYRRVDGSVAVFRPLDNARRFRASAGLIAQEEAAVAGCDQVVWLDSAERRFVEETGGMNLFFVRGNGDGARLVTPLLTGSILPGVVRDSVLTSGRDMGLQTEERPVSLQEWHDEAIRGVISETFACGTAAAIDTPCRRLPPVARQRVT